MDKLAKVFGCAIVVLALIARASAGPADDANAAVDRWAAAYSANDVEAVINAYWPDAVLLGTNDPGIATGVDDIRGYFAKLKGTGNKNAIQERRTIVGSDSAVVVTGFYEFIIIRAGQPAPNPARFTMFVTKRGNEWRIAHQHSSPRARPKQ